MKLQHLLPLQTKLGLACMVSLCSQAAFAQEEEKPAFDATPLAVHLGSVYAVVSPYDSDKDGELDKTETKALKNAISEGNIELPTPHMIEMKVKPPVEIQAGMASGIFEIVAKYDADKNGTLDDAEVAELAAAIESGELPLPPPPPPMFPPVDDEEAVVE